MKRQYHVVGFPLLSPPERVEASSPPSCRFTAASAAIFVGRLPPWQRSSYKTRS